MAGVLEVMTRLTGDPSGVVSAFGSAGAAAKSYASETEAASAKAQAAHESQMASLGKMGLAATATVATLAVVAVDMAAKFEKSTTLLATAGGMTHDQLKIAQDGILEISKSTGVAAEDLSKGMYIVSKVTKDAGEGLTILKAAAQGAVAEGVDMATMTTALTGVMTTYNKTAADAVSIENGLVAASGASKATMAEFSGSLAAVLPIAQSAGISFDQVGGAIATMTQHNTTAQEATQELRHSIQALLAPNQVQIKQMSQLGINSQELSSLLGTRGLTGTYQYLTEKILEHMEGGKVLLGTYKESVQAGQAMGTMLAGMPEPLRKVSQELMDGHIKFKEYNLAIHDMDAQSANMGQQFERLYKTSTGFSDSLRTGTPAAQGYQQAIERITGGTVGMQTMLMLTGDYMPQFQAKVTAIGEAMKETGADIATNADTQATLAAQTARTKAEFEALMIQIGQKLTPVFHDLMTAATEVFQWLTKNQDLVMTLGGVFLALGTAVTIAAGAVWVMNLALWANPVGLTILAITALVAGFVVAYEKIGWFKDAVNGFAEWNKGASKAITDGFAAVGTGLGDFQKNAIEFVDTVKRKLSEFQEGAKTFTEQTKGMFKDFNDNTKGMFTDFGTNATKWNEDNSRKLTESIGGFSTWNQSVSKTFTGFFETVGNGWKGFWKDPIGETETFWTKTTSGFTGWSKELSTTITTWESTTQEGFKGWNKEASEELKKWIDKTKEDFKKWNEEASKELKSWLTSTTEGFKTWNEQTSTDLKSWLTGTKQGFTEWNTSTSQSVTSGNAATKQSFEEWNKQTSANLTGWATNQDGGFREWNRGVSATVTGWVESTKQMFIGWGDSIRSTFQGWYDNTTGKTRQFVDTIKGNFDTFDSNTRGMFDDLGKHIQRAWNWIVELGQGAYRNIETNVFNPLKTAIGWVGDAFSNTANFIGGAWERIKEAARNPAAFVVNTVYNAGIKPAWNAISDGLHLGMSLPDAAMATGGVMPGYSPGIDNHIIAVGGGEAIMRPEWTQAVGADRVHAMNAMARSGDTGGIRGLMGFAEGGIVGDIMGSIGSFMGDALGTFNRLVGDPFRAQTRQGTDGRGNWGSMMGAIPGKVLDTLGSRIGGLVQALVPSITSGPGLANTVGNAGAGVQQWAGMVANALAMMHQSPDLLGTTLRRMNQESGGNPGAINNWDSNAMAGIPSKGLMQVIDPTFRQYAVPGFASDIWDPMSNILASMSYAISRYGSLANAYNQAGGYALGGIVPTFDKGGTLAPGLNLVNNATGAPERLTNTTHGGGMTIVLDIPELGGRLEAKIRDVSNGTVGDAIGRLASQAASGRNTGRSVFV